MPESGKILYIKKNDVTESAKTYTLPSDLIAGKPYLGLDIAGQVCYVQLDNVGAANATSGRVLKNGVEYQICSSAYIPVSFYKNWGAFEAILAVPSDYTWSPFMSLGLSSPSARTIPGTFRVMWHNQDAAGNGESHIRVLVNGTEILAWLDYTGTSKKDKTTTVNVPLIAGYNTITIQGYKPKWTRFWIDGMSISING